MTAQLERKMLSEIRDMAAMDKSGIAERYKVPIDGADDYFRTKTTAVLDVIIDGLDQEIAYNQEKEHYKGVTGE